MAGLASGSLALLAAAALLAHAQDIPPGVIKVPLIRDAEQTAYYAQFQVGTPAQKAFLKVDTGSPRYSFLASSNEVCMRETRPCNNYGTFDNTTSSYALVAMNGEHGC